MTKLRRLRLARDPNSWRALAEDAWWGLHGPCPPPAVHDSLEPDGCVAVWWPTTYQHKNAAPAVWPIRDGLSAITRVYAADIKQPYEGIVLAELDTGNGRRRFAIDYWDATHVNHGCAAEVDVYFKMQHLPDGYPAVSNVVPGGYISSSPLLYRHWCRLRQLQRNDEHKADVFGRFGLRFQADVRRRAVELLAHDERLVFCGGVTPTLKSWYLREMAQARICLDLPGNGPFCYRLVEALAMGCCVVGPRPAAVLHAELIDGVHVVRCADDLSDLADVCVRICRDDSARRQVGAAGARYFDEHLHPVALAHYYAGALAASEPVAKG